MLLRNELFREKVLFFNHQEKEQFPCFTATGRALRSPRALSHLGASPSEHQDKSGPECIPSEEHTLQMDAW